MKGQVVGVAVGFLPSGQSLNFAVPVSKVASLLRSGSPKFDPGVFDQIAALQAERQQEAYSAESDSPWQKTDTQLKAALRRAIEGAENNDSVLLRVAKAAKDSWETDIAVSTGEKLVALKPSMETHLLLAQALTQEYTFTQDDATRQQLMSRTEKEARLVVGSGRYASGEAWSVLANVLEDRGSFKEASVDFRNALDAAQKANDSDLRLSSTRGLIRTKDALKEVKEADRLLESLDREGNATAGDWSGHADRIRVDGLFQETGNAYRRAAELKGSYTNWCSAAVQFSAAGQQEESVLYCARKCIEGGTGEKDSEDNLAKAHEEIATILNARGVYSEALNNGKEASVMRPSDPFSYDDMAEALIGLRRFDEAANAAQQAIRLSDGKYGWMHFRLGSAYFSLENWEFALQSFEKAAQLNPQEPAAAYNAALSHARLRHWSDAVRWYREYLRRSPNADDKAQVLDTIRVLSQ